MKKVAGLTLNAASIENCINPETKIVQAGLTRHPDYQKGFDLVASRYVNQKDIVDTFVPGIIHGSIGKWRQMQMTPHVNLADEKARAWQKIF